MKNDRIHRILAFLFGFFVIFTLYYGLPYDFNADLLRDEAVTSSLSYSQLFRSTLTPTTPAWFFYENMAELRPFMYITHKFFFETFGANLPAVHLIMALAHGILALVFLSIVYWITGRKLYTWLLLILYASFPTNGVMLAGYVSLEIQFLLSALEILAFAALVKLTWNPPNSIFKRSLLILSWLAITWLAIKWKSSEKILPFVYFAFLILRGIKIKQRVGAGLWTILIGMNLCMFLLAVPFKQSSTSAQRENQTEVFLQKEKQMTKFKISTLVARALSLPGEENPLLKLELDESPNSFTGNLGFFLGWFFWLSLLILPLIYFLKRITFPPVPREQLELRFHAALLFFLWFASVVAGFGMGNVLTEVRYLNYALVPAILLLAFFLKFAEGFLPKHAPVQKVATLAFCAMLVFTIIQDFGFLTKWVGFYGGIQHAVYESEKMIYEDYYKTRPDPMEFLRKHGELGRRATLVTWYDHREDWFGEARSRLSQEKVLYVKSRGEPDDKLDKFQKEGLRVEKMANFSFYDAKPLFFSFSKLLIENRLKKNKNLQVVVYKVT